MKHEIRITFPEFQLECDVCENHVEVVLENTIFDSGGMFYGWRCPICRTIYNSDSNIIHIGGYENEDYASA